MRWLLLFNLLFTVFIESEAKTRGCNQGDLLGLKNHPVTEVSFAQLPKSSFVANSAEIIISKSGAKVPQTREVISFEKISTRVECLSLNSNQSTKNLFIVAPAIIDLSPSSSRKDIFWNFQIYLSAKKIGVWNQMSHISSQQKFVEWAEQKNIKFYKIHPTSYAISIEENNRGLLQTIIIKYDLVD